MKDKILNKIEAIEEQMFAGIKKIVKINSIQDTPQENMPYGKGIHDALEATLTLARDLGFETENVDNQAGIVKYGKGEEYIGIFGHLDVVEVGEGWTHPPFSAYEDENGRIFSRGILDNKGPILSNLYALYALKELGITFKYPIWIVFGTNEETGFADMKYYLTKKKPPIMGWTPDCKYPVVYAERGRAYYQVSTNKKYYQEFNAFINDYLLSSSSNADRLGLDIKDPEFGQMRLQGLQLINKSADELCFQFAFSYPASITNQKIKEIICTKLSTHLSLTCTLNYNPVYLKKDSFLCQTLKETYEEITNNDGNPVTTTGGTYAKVIPNIVPFGPSFPGQKGIGHNPDEWMDRSDLLLNTKIYALSMYQLANGEITK